MRTFNDPAFSFDVREFVPAECCNCYKEITGESWTLKKEIAIGDGVIITKKHVCLDCISEVIQYRYRLRNVAEMTGQLVNEVNSKLTTAIGFKLVPFGKVRHI